MFDFVWEFVENYNDWKNDYKKVSKFDNLNIIE